MGCMSRRQLTSAVLGATGGILSRPWPLMAGQCPHGRMDPMLLVDPELRSSLLLLTGSVTGITNDVLNAETLQRMRTEFDKASPPPGRVPHFSERVVPGSHGQPDVRVYIIGHASGAPRPAILHMHGGGYVFGRAIDIISYLQAIALRHACLIITVDYRLAPETPFPGSLEDNYAALRWLHGHADELGVDATRIAIMGESAGGGHAAALAIAARDRGEVPICLQILLYPMLDDRTGSGREPAPWIGTFVWTRAMNRFGWSSLLGVPAGSAAVPRGAVPARVEDLSALPASFLCVGSIDLFIDEDVEYARRLLDAGVLTELLVLPGAYHGFDVAPSARATLQYTQALDNAIARAFGKV